MANGLATQPLVSHGGLNYIFLIEILICGILALFFLFYFNRLFATIVSYLIRAYTWHKYRAYIDITALQISLLGGRIFFKSIRYHGHNVTCLVHEGHITWRYWLRVVQDAEVFLEDDAARKEKSRPVSASQSENDGKSSSNEKQHVKSRSRSIGKEESAGGKPKKELPCRISIKVSGVEAFVYNRSPSYDIVLEQTLRKVEKTPPTSSSSNVKASDDAASPLSSNSGADKKHRFGFSTEKTDTNDTTDTTDTSATKRYAGNDTSSKPDLPAFLRLFPFRLECRRAAATLGNENTTNVIVAKVHRAEGTIDAGHAGPLDLYKLLFQFDIEKSSAVMRPNQDFKLLQLDAAKRILREKETGPTPSRTPVFDFLRRARERWQGFTGKLSKRKSTARSLRTASLKSEVRGSVLDGADNTPGQAQWSGLDRYMEDRELNEHDEWKDVEYAKASTLADIEKLHMKFYFDMPGTVPNDIMYDDAAESSAYDDDMNRSKPPEYGMDFAVHGGVVTYGPWADRQRLNIQQIFLPASFVDAVPSKPLQPGETRSWSVFKIFISIEEDVVLRIPSREPSKDEKWQGRGSKANQADDEPQEVLKKRGKHGRKYRHARRRKGKQGNPVVDARPYGWLDIIVKTDTTVTYTMDMFPRSNGYRNSLDVDCKATEINSSVNHGLLWRTGPISVVADLSQRGPWNTLRKWPFDIIVNDMELFILRDHLFLIIDLVNDWSYGPPVDFYTFVPYIYNLRLLLRNFIMYLNVNDANIVNDAADFDKNDFLTLEGVLDSTLNVHLDQYRPVRNLVTFDVLGTNMRMRMLSPSRSTINSLLKDKVVADLPKLTLYGSFSGHLEERPGLIDTLRFDIVGSGLTLKAYGFLVRQLINIKENYFGDYLHFKTLEEFQDADEDLAVANIKMASIPKPKYINELDVMLCIVAEDVTVLVPTNLYNGTEFVRAELPLANLDLRIVSYYLDMGLQLSPVSILSGKSSAQDDSPVESQSQTQFFCKHVNLDGHRSFGLPPDEPAYISQWDIDIGAISGELSSSFTHDLAMGGRAFIFGFEDRENTLPLPPPSVFYEATFVQVRTDTLRLWLHAGNDALLLATDPIEVVTNDWASDAFSQRVSVVAPKVTFASIDAKSASRQRAHEKRKVPVKTHAFFQTGAAVNVILRKLHSQEEMQKQQAYIRGCDERTNRAPFLLRQGKGVSTMQEPENDFYPPTMPYPYLPPPVSNTGSSRQRPASIKSIPSFAGPRLVRNKSSSSSLSASIRNGSLAVPEVTKLKQSERSGGTASSSASVRSSSPARSEKSSILKQQGQDRRKHGGLGLHAPSIAFASSFAEPHFPLDMIELDETQVPEFESVSFMEDADSDADFIFEAIDNPDVEHDAAQVSVMIQITPGIRAYLEPRIVETGAYLFRKILPKEPDEVMDAFQMDVMGAVAAKQTENHGSNQTLEIQASLPSARIRVVNPGPSPDTNDQLDLGLRYIDTLVRVRSLPSSNGVSETLAIHATAKGINASLGRPGLMTTDGPAFQANIDDVLVWVTIAAARSIHATVEDTNVSVSGEQAESIVDFVLRLLPLINDLTAKVEAPIELYHNRLLLMIRTLTQQEDDIGDPAPLSRLTYILRAFPDHFRNQESWKVVTKIRHILQNARPKLRNELQMKLKRGELDCPSDVPAKALTHWAQWQTWDVPNIHATVAFQILFSEEEEKAMQAPEDNPLLLTVRSDYLRVAVEAENAANEVVIRETSLGLESTPPTAPTGLVLADENTRTRTLGQMHSSSIALLFNWSAFSIAERVLAFKDKLQQLPVPKSSRDEMSASQKFEDSLYRHIFQIVVSTDSGSISLKSINLQHLSRADGLKLSLVGTTQAADDGYGAAVTGIVNADTAITELFGNDAPIWRTNLTSPSVYADHVRPLVEGEFPPSTYVAVGYKELKLGLLEQVPGLLQIADSVILGEVTKILDLMKSTSAGQSSASERTALAPTDTLSSKPVKIHVALLAGDLLLEVSLLQSITYQLTGTAASVRLAPSFMNDRAWAIDFDVGRQSHRFIDSSSKKRHEESLLDIPPINGHVGLELKRKLTSLSVAATMQQIEVNAAAIQGVVSTLNQPEVQDVISTIKSGIDDIKAHVLKLQPESPGPKVQVRSSEKQLAFEVRFALLGIRVAAHTRRSKDTKVEVAFGIGPLHAIASNRDTLGNSMLLLPEVRAQVRDIGARLQIREKGHIRPCGHLTFGLDLHFKSQMDRDNKLARTLRVQSRGLEVNAYPDTASTAVGMINKMQERLKSLDLTKELKYLRRARDSRRQSLVRKMSSKELSTEDGEAMFSAADLLSVTTTVQLDDIRVTWIVDQSYASSQNARIADLVLSLERIEFTTRGGREARLAIEDLQLSLVRKNAPLAKRSLNSALLPEMSFSVGYWTVGSKRSLAFKAAGKPLELRLESRFLVPVNALSKSINYSIESFRAGTANWQSTVSAVPATTETPIANLLDTKKLASLLVEADFAGALFYVQGSGSVDQSLAALTASHQQHGAQHGRYGQFAADGANMQTSLRAPGIAIKVEYNAAKEDRPPTLNGEIRVDASSNKLLPNVVPLILEMSHSVREIMKSQQAQAPAPMEADTESKPMQKLLEDDSIVVADPTVLFGKTKLDIGFRVCRQEFGLTCQPIARVDAKAELDDFYFTVNTIESDEHGHFFAITAVVTKLGAQVKHMYSREPTFTFDMESIVLSVMNSKHLGGEAGISAILKINPTKTFINGKQLQDLLLFREIWIPPEIRKASSAASQPSSNRQDEFFMQKYRAAAAAAAFPWNATVSIAELAIDLDLGQSIGKSSFSITNLWVTQTKSSGFEQNLCVGMDEMAMNSSGRMSGFIRLNKLGARTSIRWPQDEAAHHSKTPLIQASLGFRRLLVKAAFEYQAFAFGDIEGFDFLMYNVHQAHGGARDRLVAVLDCEKAYVFCTSTSPARAVGLFQAVDRLIQEKQNAFEQSLRDMERHIRRESTIVPTRFGPKIPDSPVWERSKDKGTISLHTDVVLRIGTISFGVYPGTFFDSQILKLEANTIQGRFAVGIEHGKVASALGMTLGQLQVALASVKKVSAVPKALDISVDEVISNAINASGGTILRVPKVVASMQTWQAPHSNDVDYIFKSLFEGKIDVGWNLSRIDFIKNMYTAHARSLANRLGKALPESAVRITAGPASASEGSETGGNAQGQDKITAEVNLPQSRYDYHPLEPPIIETPQLRDMGEATPPLEWIGLHRDRLPNVTHQIVIIPLLEVVEHVEDAYRSILGSGM